MTSDPTDQTLLRAAETIRSLRGRITELQEQQGRAAEPIAIVAATCRLPGGANSPEAYWELVASGRDAVRPLTGDRWRGIDFGALDDPAFARLAQHAGQIDEVDGFDGEFFAISDTEADLMDPQQRILLEIAWEATERAGWTPDELERTPTGVFIGAGHQDYMLASLAARPDVSSRLSTGSGARSLLANRLSFQYGFQGPSMTVDTACSSSLVAVHLACQSLRAGDCDRALAGGVNLILSPLSTTMTGRALPLAPDGRTKALAADADGMVRGEGAGLVALKRLSDALADGDPIEAVILADATNQDGRTNGLTAPSALAQEALMRRTLHASGKSAQDITFVEMHGTGTPLGDPIEYEAIRAVYGTGGDQAPTCWLGSVKANLGHLESAAGVASLIKAVGALRHGRIPQQINLGEISPFIDLEGERFAVPRRLEPWTSTEARYAAVSSFGFGGTNAHLIIGHPDAVPAVREYANRPERSQDPGPDAPALIPLSARTGPALAAQLEQFAAHLEGMDAPQIQQAATAAARRRGPHPRRAAVCAARPELLPDALRRAANSPAVLAASPAARQNLAFVYSGQSAQWPRMGISLAGHDSLIREELTAWDEAVRQAGGPPLLATLAGPESERALADTRFAQLAIAALQAALTERLRDWGLIPVAVCGHSVGEVSAAVAAGALSREQAVQVLLARGEALHQHAAGGAMLAVRAPAAEVAAALAKAQSSPSAPGTGVGIAAVNSPQGTVISGPAKEMEALREHLSHWRVTRLATDYAFHSPGLGPVAEQLLTDLKDLQPAASRTPVYSSVTGSLLPGEHLRAGHWADNAARPVLFGNAVDAMLADGVSAFVELGPHPALLPHLQRALDQSGVKGAAVATLRKNEDERLGLRAAVGQLWSAGCAVDWAALHPGPARMVTLPTYPWQRKKHWVTHADPATDTTAAPTGAAAAPAGPGLDESAVLGRLITHLADFMQADAEALDPDRSARDLDIDSVSIVELKNRLENDLGTPIPITVLMEGATLRDIARTLTAAGNQRGPTSEEARRALENLDDLSEEELDRLLAALDSEDGR
ncbi:type I polyketide synthase [Streptomyces kanamyceticus]|uniref:Type I polyketide synthase n=1 Tax=Streptomyces kanamyceticus TaxID=1967 RepID=A0A5J6GA94_STRKN|nr:type I polyketide synthase [Streptomyces kanamyceticus]QEU90186.1 type I polyketide synthase [Streptomyces kanamyceticus]